MNLRGKSKTSSMGVPAVNPEERETHVSYSVGDLRHGGSAFVETFDPSLKAKVLRAGGRLRRTYKTKPEGWSLEIPATLIRVTVKKTMKKPVSEKKEPSVD